MVSVAASEWVDTNKSREFAKNCLNMVFSLFWVFRNGWFALSGYWIPASWLE
jgi:hypothetical protein